MDKKREKTVTMKLNRDGSVTFRSTGGYDLRKLFSNEMPLPAGETIRATTGERMEAEPVTETSSVSASPHTYWPSVMHMGDCRVCGNVQDHPLHQGKAAR